MCQEPRGIRGEWMVLRMGSDTMVEPMGQAKLRFWCQISEGEESQSIPLFFFMAFILLGQGQGQGLT